MKNKYLIGNLMTLLTMIIWGTTYISTKVLLQNLHPMEILFYRFIIAYIILMLIYPKFKKPNRFKEEVLFLAAGFTGVTLYYLLENIALEYTLASNVGLLISMAPILTAIFSYFLIDHENLNKNLLYGFIISMIGVFLVIFNGNFILKLNPLGDFLAILAAIVWAIYSVILKKINDRYNYSYIYITRKIFFYGVIFMILMLFIFKVNLDLQKLIIPNVLFNILFLSLIASALCFVMWNIGVKFIGAVKASNYIYIVPLITATASIILLKETITSTVIAGAVFILSGLYISQNGDKNPFKSLVVIIKKLKIKKNAMYENK